MQHQVAGKVLRLLPVWFTVLLLVQLLLFNASAEDRCHFNEAVCSVKAMEDNYWLRATCDNDAVLIVSLEAPSGELQDVRRAPGRENRCIREFRRLDSIRRRP